MLTEAVQQRIERILKMTPKQQYEARKAERQKLKDLDYQVRQREEQIATLDMMDRFVTAMERIADALERPQAQASTLVLDPNSASGFRVPNTFGVSGSVGGQ
jgi:crotonobetainyl-CoA:carnitine CoA-transferase CaiB-like acyl-CoA transferase